MNRLKLIAAIGVMHATACDISGPEVPAPDLSIETTDVQIGISDWTNLDAFRRGIASVEGYVTRYGGCDYLVPHQFVGKAQFEEIQKIHAPGFPFVLCDTQGFTRCTVTGDLIIQQAIPGSMFIRIREITFPEFTASREMEEFIESLEQGDKIGNRKPRGKT